MNYLQISQILCNFATSKSRKRPTPNPSRNGGEKPPERESGNDPNQRQRAFFSINKSKFNP